MKRSFLQSMGLALALVFVPQLAAAQTVGGDLVILNNGGRLRGVVSEYDPGVRVVIQLPDGTARTVVAADIASVTFADAQAVPAPVNAPVEQTPAQGLAAPVLAPTIPAPVEVPASPPAPTVERWTAPRVYTSERLPEWTNFARDHAERLPHGSPHFGLQLEGGAHGIAGRGILALQGVGTLVALVDFTTGPFGVIRIGGYASFAAEGQWVSTWSRALGFGVRFQGGVDIGSAFVRVGADVGGAAAHGAFGVEGMLRTEFGGRLLDARTLELGVGLGVGVTPVGFVERGYPDENLLSYVALFPRLDVFLGWVFQ